jgi:hypothetical protein
MDSILFSSQIGAIYLVSWFCNFNYFPKNHLFSSHNEI